MTKYNFMGTQVDVKATNLHGSATVDATPGTDNAGSTTQIGVGTVVMSADNTTIKSATQALEITAIGIVTETRVASDTRPVAYTYFGWVRVMSSAAIAVGAPLRIADGGKVVTGTLGTHRIIGRALTSTSDTGQILQAFVFFGQ